MSYDLFIGDKGFSSWSLRGWLLFEKFDIPFREHMIGLYSGTMQQDLAPLAPARFVPTARTPEGWVIGESIALAETLAERHPEAGIWPADPEARVFARWLVAEMHAGFAALRSACSMQLFHQYQGFVVSDAVQTDLDRLETMLGHAFAHFSGAGPWLFGAYSAADAFYAPVAARIAGYDLPVSERLTAYVAAHLNDPAFKAWRAEGIKLSYDPMPYALDLPKTDWPVAP
ncbi:MAG: glutathione S-transferase [Alphaproteobacteria bacterium]|nr:glutathione S-transferase [Alphaproteobacteria bacterium]MBU1278901.1 glutathione S-transferase [Alphaproteobacteria bacterium]MBU1571947.1 glutathione S-transferase [Alphaproteobacteria bacterium]MBU1830355.1 glutathione S-transferase [Alphaproteobacteria bacterium]MBU2078204.1 glutathione S-transferase [Alphaproteobacteria bacterium]